MQKKIWIVIIGIIIICCVLGAVIYKAMGEKDVSQEELIKSLLHLTLIDEQGVEHFGSGYILEIDQDNVYICSNAHVLYVAEQGKAYFYDGEQAEFTCLGYDEIHDVGIAVIEKTAIAEKTLSQLQKIPVSKKRWELFLQEGGALSLTLLGKEGVVETKSGQAVGFVTNKYFEDIVLEMTIPLVAGNSGSAIVDEKGYLVGMAIGEVREIGFDLQYFAAPLDDIAEVYEVLTGNKLY
ncbi:MAG: serine protease [Lachnospiraceae bacterium]|nr:serine protease [Lachnospiraceae bacterium]